MSVNIKMNDRKYLAIDIARYVVNKCNDDESPISNLKLQKVLYFIQGNFFLLRKKECFVEDMHAWDYGPVVPEVYREFKCFGSNNIPRIDKVYRINMESFDFEEQEFNMEFYDKDDKDVVDEVIDMCKRYTASSLVGLTHRQRPWLEKYKAGQDNIIDKYLIKEYFNNGQS